MNNDERGRLKAEHGSELKRWGVSVCVFWSLLVGSWPGLDVLESEVLPSLRSSFSVPRSAFAAEPTERHLANIRQLTVGRKNAEAYFSFDGTKLIFQSTNDW